MMARGVVDADLAVQDGGVDVAAQEAVLEGDGGPVGGRLGVGRPAQLVPGIPYHHVRRRARRAVAVVLWCSKRDTHASENGKKLPPAFQCHNIWMHTSREDRDQEQTGRAHAVSDREGWQVGGHACRQVFLYTGQVRSYL